MKNDYILIEELEEERTKSGLWLPPNPHNRRAKVLNVSIEEEDIKVGDTVLKNIGKSLKSKPQIYR